MNNKERQIELQIAFSRKNIGIFVALITYIIINLATTGSFKMTTNVTIPCFVLGITMLADVIFALSKFFHNNHFLKALKLVEIVVVGLLINYSTNTMGSAVDLFAISVYILLCVEFGYVVDMFDTSAVWLTSLVVQLPFLIKMIRSIILHAPDLYDAFGYFAMACIMFVIMFAIYSYICAVQSYNEQCLYSKDRMLDSAKDSYGKIAENQSKMMTANELLSVKKFELEEAYRKINLINDDINFQNQILKIASSTLEFNKVINKCSDAIIEKQNDVFYAGILFKDRRYNRNFSKQLEKMLEPMELVEFMNFFLSDAFRDEQFSTGIFYVNNEISYDEFPFLERVEARSIIVKSLKVQVQSDEYECAYIIMSRHINAFLGKETVYDNILRQIEAAVNNIFMYSKIKELSNRDGLSGLYNRRYLNLYYDEHFVKSTIDGTAIAALLDIDHFKKINDTYGHLFGDQAIIMVANVINSIASQNDGITFRYGGEEFVVLFENISLQDGVAIMERIRNSIKETPIEYDNKTVYVNVSVGVAGYPDTTKDLSILIDRADKAMYYSKNNGRDRLTVDNDEL